MRIADLNSVIDLDIEGLVKALADTKAVIKNMEQARYLVETRLIEMMEDTGATVATTSSHVVKMTMPVTYDYNILARLREITDPQLLEECYEPAGEKVVKTPEKWNMTKAKKLGAYGSEHASIINDPRILQRPRISVSQTIEKGHTDLDTIDHDHDMGIRDLTDPFDPFEQGGLR